MTLNLSQLLQQKKPLIFAGAQKCLENGASIIGGCCGTTLEHIKEILKL